MGQLAEYRRKVLKKSQEELSVELGYEKWQTYAAQEQGKNPIPEDVKSRLRARPFKFGGKFPDEEDGPVTKADLNELRDHLDRKIESILEVLRALGEKV